MKTVEQLRNVAQDLIASYDARLDAVGTIMDNTYQILDDFKEKRTKLSAELRETLAKRESLRKSDFDRMMNGILLGHEEKEKEIKQDLRNFLTEQKKEARELKDALMQGEVEKMKKAQTGIERGIAEVRGLLKGFYEEQEGLTQELGELLTKGKDLKIKDLKDMTRNLQTLTRTKEVKRMGLHDVATDIKALGQDMAASHVDRTASIDALKKESRAMMETFQQENVERVNEVREMLSNFQDENTQRQHEVGDLLTNFQKENAQRRAEVTQMLASFDELMHNVHKENEKFKKGVHQFMKGVHTENVQRSKEVNKLMEGFRDEIGALAGAVRQMWATAAGVKGVTKRVSAGSYAGAAPKKPARRGKKKPK